MTIGTGMSRSSKWANRFILAAIVQGALAAGLTAYFLYVSKYPQDSLDPGPARIVAGGGAGTWLAMGYLAYIIFGPLAVAVTSLFYQHIEVVLGGVYKGAMNALGWIHLVLMNVGVVGGTWIMMNGGYRGAALAINLAAADNAACSCTTHNAAQYGGQVHVQVLSGLVDPIGYFALVAVLGAFAGGVGYMIAWRRAMKSPISR
jgi:hypothetical protein